MMPNWFGSREQGDWVAGATVSSDPVARIRSSVARNQRLQQLVLAKARTKLCAVPKIL